MFDRMEKDDILLAFFPCTLFQEKNTLIFCGKQHQQLNHTVEQNLEEVIERHKTLNKFYTVLCKLFLVCLRKGFRLIVENPYSEQHYLVRYFPVKAAFIDKDRTWNGDAFKKPTQYWFVNCEPKGGVVFEPITYKTTKRIQYITGSNVRRERSEITSEYANRFIRAQIFGENRK